MNATNKCAYKPEKLKSRLRMYIVYTRRGNTARGRAFVKVFGVWLDKSGIRKQNWCQHVLYEYYTHIHCRTLFAALSLKRKNVYVQCDTRYLFDVIYLLGVEICQGD